MAFNAERCVHTNDKGIGCRNRPLPDGELCWRHSEPKAAQQARTNQKRPKARHCAQKTPAGQTPVVKCNNWAIPGTRYCRHHQPDPTAAKAGVLPPRVCPGCGQEMKGTLIRSVPSYPHLKRCTKMRALLPELAPAAPPEVAETPFLLPGEIRQPTFQEARNAAIALADGASLHRWQPDEFEASWRHQLSRRDPLVTKLTTAGSVLDWLALPKHHEQLRQELQNLRFPAVLLFNVAIGLLLETPQITISLDTLMGAIGWHPKGIKERAEMRRQAWRWLLLFNSLSVVGQRPGVYKDRSTGRKIEVTSVDVFLRVSGYRQALQTSIDGSEPPLEVSLVAGPWIDRYRGNGQVLTTFADVRRIAAIPAGRPSGSWAQAAGMALQQVWRERATEATVEHSEQGLSVCFPRALTRRQLLGMFRCEPPPATILEGNDPTRARGYWAGALYQLQKAGVVSCCTETAALPKGRSGWQEAWLDQPLDVRPGPDGARLVAEISQAAASAASGRRSAHGRA